MKVLLLAPTRGASWLGGQHYFQGLVHALVKHPPGDGSTVTVLTNSPASFAQRAGSGVHVVHAPWLDPARPLGFANGAANTLLQVNPLLRRHARAIDADLVTHATPVIASPCPVLFWMPDFQHRHLPGNFSRYERWRRDRNVRATRRHGHILFSSESASADFQRFYPDVAGAVLTHVLRFPPFASDRSPTSRAELFERYALQGGFFLVPNQFWKHKNHQVVVQALAMLPKHYRVVCTGAMSDSRGAGHIADIRQAIGEASLQERFVTLGVVARNDLLGLMREAACVINPSLFEGWSTVVQEAKLEGKQLILSDIPVHREQDPADALFFPPDDAGALAIAMEEAVRRHDPALDEARRARAREALPGEVATFAGNYWRIAREAGRQASS